jgi:hypothetical protein
MQRWLQMVCALGLACSWPALALGQEPALTRRWVGTHQGRPLVLDFYADTLLVVNDERPVAFRVTRDSLAVTGDSSFSVSYWFVRDRLLLQTAEGAILTMAPQGLLARPLHGEWHGSGTGNRRQIELRMSRGGEARWRRLPNGRWQSGEWDRRTRTVTFTWLPDSTIWTAQYDPPAGALLFTETEPGSGTVVLRRAFRW